MAQEAQITGPTEEEVTALEAETFDIGDFLNQEWEFPTFWCTVHLDGKSAGEVAALDERIEELNKRIKTKARENRTASSGSLGGPSGPDVRAEEAEIERLRAEREPLSAKVAASALKVAFQLPRPAEQIRKETEEFLDTRFKHLPKDKRRDDDEYNVAWGVQTMALCLKEIRNAKGQKNSRALSFEDVRKLLDKLTSAEQMRLQQASTMAISGGNAMQRAADAGFPG